ncbi:MAG: hypothetical protein CSA22_01680 [Deltaproteobacteria bacterium]|nr:MAG: hypothetical protein CSA22_01680 [Deltaproteobacteria bacterium]
MISIIPESAVPGGLGGFYAALRELCFGADAVSKMTGDDPVDCEQATPYNTKESFFSRTQGH